MGRSLEIFERSLGTLMQLDYTTGYYVQYLLETQHLQIHLENYLTQYDDKWLP